ncbi:hypothetical protein JD844_022957 [Phrynosoma platyrhinos]|uniref:MI domain-containing protein n=1 Tax=Phrynosoma platyrhinos TaxID=52577 RepID=A0ABQ7SVZ3_PHRPL|nr:hypothetical protein JD844_022957 [Phrynosoma platyrhinos]
MDFPESQTKELCNMILDCCAQQRTYEKFFGLLAGRFCMLKKEYMESFEAIFKEQYDTIHRLETNKLRNVAKMFAHLLYTDSLPWSVLECIMLSEETTTSSSRIFVKIFFQELSEYMGLPNLNARLKDETLQPFFEGLLPRDNPRNTRFAINFFTSIGLGGLTDELREHLKNAPKIIMTQKQDVESSDSSSSSESDSSGLENDASSSSSSGISGSSSQSESSSDSDHSSDSDVKRKKSQKKKTSDKDTKRKEGSRKKHLEKKKERGQPKRENGTGRNPGRDSDRNPRDSSRREEASEKFSYGRDYSSDRNSYWSGKDRDQERNVPFESKASHSKKKQAERRHSFSDDEGRDRHYSKEGELHRQRKNRSRSRERRRNYPSPREEEERGRDQDQFKESRRDENRRKQREDSPRRRR